jgi:hypothetical protein
MDEDRESESRVRSRAERARANKADAMIRAKKKPTAEERDKQDHDRYVERIYPRLAPDQRPRIIPIDPDSCSLSGGDSLGLGELCLGCDGHMPFVSESGALNARDFLFIEYLNGTSWGHRDATTAIALCGGSSPCRENNIRAVISTTLRSFAVYRGGKQFSSEPEVLFVLPPAKACALRGTLSASAAMRSIDFGISLDQATRLLVPCESTIALRDNRHYSRFCDFHIFARYPNGGPGEDIVRTLCAGAGLVMPPVIPPQINIDDVDDQTTCGASARLAAIGEVRLSDFANALSAAPGDPTRWYCVLITDPKVYSSQDVDCLTRGLRQSISECVDRVDVAADEEQDQSVMMIDDDASRLADGINTAGMISVLLSGKRLYDRECDAWIRSAGDNGLTTMTAAIIDESAKSSSSGTGGLDDLDISLAGEEDGNARTVEPMLQTCAALATMRVLKQELEHKYTAENVNDIVASIALLRAAQLVRENPLLSDLSVQLFTSLTRMHIKQNC